MRLIVLMFALGFTLAPLAVHAQLAGRPVKIGVLCAGSCPFGASEIAIRPFIDALERVGLVRGRTLALVDIGSVVPSEDQVVGEAQKLVSRRPDLILVWTGSVAAARAAKDATHTIPIVLMAVPDVVEHGLVDSLARPGGSSSNTLVGYGPPFAAIAERTASLIDRIIKGTRPGDLPIDGVMAKALGLTIPQSVLRADQVIE